MGLRRSTLKQPPSRVVKNESVLVELSLACPFWHCNNNAVVVGGGEGWLCVQPLHSVPAPRTRKIDKAFDKHARPAVLSKEDVH